MRPTSTPPRDRLFFAVLTTIAAAVVYAVIALLLGDALAFGGGQIVALAVVFVLSYLWAPAIRRGPS